MLTYAPLCSMYYNSLLANLNIRALAHDTMNRAHTLPTFNAYPLNNRSGAGTGTGTYTGGTATLSTKVSADALDGNTYSNYVVNDPTGKRSMPEGREYY